MTDEAVWRARLERERNARRAAERLLETRANELLGLNRHRGQSLRTLLPHALAALILIAVGATNYVLAQRQAAAIATREGEALTRQLAGAVADDIARVLESTDLLLRYAEIRQATARPETSALATLAVPGITPVRDVLTTDAAGMVRAATHPRFLGAPVAGIVDLGLVAQAVGPVLGTRPVAPDAIAAGGGGEAPVIPMARAVQDGSGAFAGAVVALLDLGHLQAVAARGAAAFEAVASLHALDGGLLASAAPEGSARDGTAAERWFLRAPLVSGQAWSFTGVDGRGPALTAGIAVTRVIPLIVEVHQAQAVVQQHAREHARAAAVTTGSVVVAGLALIGLLARGRQLSATAEAKLQSLLADQRRSHAELQVLIAAMPGTLIRIEPAGDGGWRSTYIAPSFVGLTGSPAHRIAPDWLAARTTAAGVESFDAALRLAAEQGEASVELLLHHGDGTERRIAVRMSAGAPADDRPEVICVWSDVTRERELERQLVHANKMAQLGEVATGVAHELNQPLTAISMAAENAVSMLAPLAGNTDRLRSKLGTVVSMVMRARDVVDHMRIFGRTDTTTIGPVELHRVACKASELIGEKLRRADIAMELHAPPEPVRALAKEVPLEQVVINLLANASDAYTGRALPGPRPVVVTAGIEAGWAVLTVQDRAGGIPPGIMERIFEPFFTTKPPGKGTGLGLSLSFGIVADLGGTLSVANRDGGARFTIRLPLAPAA